MAHFITFEGVEGSGKSTQIELLAGALSTKGAEPLKLREPGGTALGESIRPILLNDATEELCYISELLLYEASRAQLVSRVIRPALDSERTVICDRFIDSTIAYQGYARGLDVETIERLNTIATDGLVPSLTILLDLDPALGLKRALKRIEALDSGSSGNREDRFEKEALAFHDRVRNGFLTLAAEHQMRIRVVDAARDEQAIHSEIASIVKGLESKTG